MRIKLKDAFELQIGKTPSRNKSEYWNGVYKWVSISDIGNSEKYVYSTRELITDKGIIDSGVKVIPKGTVIMSFKLSIGKTAITTEDMYTNEAIVAFIDKKKIPIDIDYMYYLCSGSNWMQGVNKAVMGLTLNKATLSEKEINIPNIEIQKKCACNLDKIDRIIDLKKQQLDQLDLLVRSLFIEMFGDPIENPMNWDVKELGDYITVLTDFNSNGSYELLDSNVVMKDEPDYAWIVRITDLETMNEKGRKYIDEKTWNLLEKSKICGNEIIMCKIGSAGKIYIMPNTGKPASLGRNAFMFRFNELLEREYVYYLLNTDYGIKEITQYVRGAVTKTITKDDVRRLRVIVPPINEQRKFISFINKIDKSKLAVKKSLEELEVLKKSLMQKYFA